MCKPKTYVKGTQHTPDVKDMGTQWCPEGIVLRLRKLIYHAV